MRPAVQTTKAIAIAALIGVAPLQAWSQVANVLGETDGRTSSDRVDTAASSAGPVVSPVHTKTRDLAKQARDAAKAATASSSLTPAPVPATDTAEPAIGQGGNAAPLGNQPADSLPETPISTPPNGVTPNHGSAIKAQAKVRTLRA